LRTNRPLRRRRASRTVFLLAARRPTRARTEPLLLTLCENCVGGPSDGLRIVPGGLRCALPTLGLEGAGERRRAAAAVSTRGARRSHRRRRTGGPRQRRRRNAYNAALATVGGGRVLTPATACRTRGGGKSRPARKIAAAAEGRHTCATLQRARGVSCEHSCVGTPLVCLSGLPPLPPHPPTSASVEGVACLRSRFLHGLFTKVSRAKINFATKRDGDTGPVQTSRTIYVKMLCAVLRWADRFPGPRYTFCVF
jgi:hypothetical protein